MFHKRKKLFSYLLKTSGLVVGLTLLLTFLHHGTALADGRLGGNYGNYSAAYTNSTGNEIDMSVTGGHNATKQTLDFLWQDNSGSGGPSNYLVNNCGVTSGVPSDCVNVFGLGPGGQNYTVTITETADGQSAHCLSSGRLNVTYTQSGEGKGGSNTVSLAGFPITVGISNANCGGVQAGPIKWYSTDTQKQPAYSTPPSEASNPFIFTSPLQIYDSLTKEYYETDGLSGTFSSGGEDYFNDGTMIYWPVGTSRSASPTANLNQTPIGGTCYGGLAVNNSYSHDIGQIFLVPTYNEGGDCRFGSVFDSFEVAQFAATTYGLQGQAINPDTKAALTQQKWQFNQNFSEQNRQLLFSMFYWINPLVVNIPAGCAGGPDGPKAPGVTCPTSTTPATPTLGVYDAEPPYDTDAVGLQNIDTLSAATTTLSGTIISAVSSSPATKAAMTAIKDETAGSGSFYVLTTSACYSQYSDNPPFVLVNYDGSNTSLDNFDVSGVTGSGNDQAWIFSNGGTGSSGWTAGWSSQGGTGCLFDGHQPLHDDGDGGAPLGGPPAAATFVGSLYNSVNPGGQQQGTGPNTGGDTGSSGVCNTSPGSDCTAVTSCSATWDNPLSWFLCPIIAGIQDFMNYVGGEINKYLTVPAQYFDASNHSSGQALYLAWNSMRALALAVLFIAAILMVFSQAISFGPFDAYTVKKLLPRILIAAIFVTISWQLVGLLVNISNGVGESVRSLMFAPFSRLGDLKATGGDLGGLSLITAGAFALGVDIIGVLALGLSAALALGVGLAVLVLRQIVILILAVFSPLAIVFLIFPGTNKAWKLWWDSFSGALLMFPIIEAFIAAGSIFAAISVNVNRNALSQFVGFIAIYLPYFLLPETVRLAGGAIGAIGGKVKDAHSGVQKGLGGYRQKRRGEVLQKERVGKRWSGQKWIPGSRRIADRANTMTKGAGTGLSGHFGLGERGDQATATLLQAAGDAALKDQPGLLNTFTRQDDTSALMGLSEGTATGAGRAARMLQEHWYKTSLQSDTEANLQSGMTQEAATAAAEISARASSARRTKSAFESARTLGINKVNAVAALTVMSQNKSRSIGTGEYEMIQGAISRLSGGNNQLAQDLAYNYQYNSRQAGREDLGGDWTGGAASRATTPEGKRRAVFMDAMSKTDTRTLLAGHPNTVKQAGEVIHGDLNGGDLETATKSAALLSELHANLASATDGNRDEVINILNGEGIRLDEPIEEQIAYKLTKIATNDGRTLTLPQAQAVLKNYSRNWGSSTPVQGREGEPPQQNPSPQV